MSACKIYCSKLELKCVMSKCSKRSRHSNYYPAQTPKKSLLTIACYSRWKPWPRLPSMFQVLYKTAHKASSLEETRWPCHPRSSRWKLLTNRWREQRLPVRTVRRCRQRRRLRCPMLWPFRQTDLRSTWRMSNWGAWARGRKLVKVRLRGARSTLTRRMGAAAALKEVNA